MAGTLWRKESFCRAEMQDDCLAASTHAEDHSASVTEVLSLLMARPLHSRPWACLLTVSPVQYCSPTHKERYLWFSIIYNHYFYYPPQTFFKKDPGYWCQLWREQVWWLRRQKQEALCAYVWLCLQALLAQTWGFCNPILKGLKEVFMCNSIIWALGLVHGPGYLFSYLDPRLAHFHRCGWDLFFRALLWVTHYALAKRQILNKHSHGNPKEISQRAPSGGFKMQASLQRA